MLWMNVIQLPLNLMANAVTASRSGSRRNSTSRSGSRFSGIMVCGFTAHYCLTNAFRNGDAIVVTPIDFLRVPLIGLFGWLVYNERPDVAVLIGAAIVVAGVLINIYAESRSRP